MDMAVVILRSAGGSFILEREAAFFRPRGYPYRSRSMEQKKNSRYDKILYKKKSKFVIFVESHWEFRVSCSLGSTWKLFI